MANSSLWRVQGVIQICSNMQQLIHKHMILEKGLKSCVYWKMYRKGENQMRKKWRRKPLKNLLLKCWCFRERIYDGFWRNLWFMKEWKRSEKIGNGGIYGGCLDGNENEFDLTAESAGTHAVVIMQFQFKIIWNYFKFISSLM